MKNLFAFLTILTVMALASCSSHTESLSESGNTALDLYFQYADRENLTVAYLGDFSLEGCKIDALMIQANDEEDWEQLKSEFGMQSEADSLGDSADLEGEKKVSVGLEIDADFVSELGLDTITDLGQVDEGRFNRLTQIIADKMREVVNATVADDSPVIIGDKSMSLDEYLNTLAVAVATDLLNEVVEKTKQYDKTIPLPLQTWKLATPLVEAMSLLPTTTIVLSGFSSTTVKKNVTTS